MLQMCGETEEKLAQELIQFEFQIERDVVEPLYVLAEVSRRCSYLMHLLHPPDMTELQFSTKSQAEYGLNLYTTTAF